MVQLHEWAKKLEGEDYDNALNYLEEVVKASKKEERERILKLIDEDIDYQKSQLGNEYDKSIKWRVIGLENLKKKIKEEKCGT